MEGVADGIDRCAVDDDPVKAFQELGQECGDIGLEEEFGGIGSLPPGRDDGESLHGGGADDFVEGSLSAQQVGESPPLLTTEESPVDGGPPHVGVDDENLLALEGEGDGAVDGGEGLSLLRNGAGEEEGAGLLLCPKEGDGGAEGAVALSEDGSGVVDGGDEVLAASFGILLDVTLSRASLSPTDGGDDPLGHGLSLIGDGGEDGKSGLGLGLVDGVDGTAHGITKDDPGDGEEGEPKEGEDEHFEALGLGGLTRDEGLLDDTVRRGLCSGGDAGLLHAGEDRLVEGAVGLDLADKGVVGDGELVELEGLGFLLFLGCLHLGLGLLGGLVLLVEDVARLGGSGGQVGAECVDAALGGEVLGMLLEVALLERGELGLDLEELLTDGGDLGEGRDAIDTEHVLGASLAGGLELLEVALELEPGVLGRADGSAGVLELLDDDVLALVEGDGVVLLAVALELLLGLLESGLELVGFLLEVVVSDVGDVELLLEALLDELSDHGLGQGAGKLGIVVLHGDVDEAGEAAELDRDLLLHEEDELAVGVGLAVGARLGEVGVLLEVVGLDHAQEDVAAGEGLNDGVDEVDVRRGLLGEAFSLEEFLVLLLDLKDGPGLVDVGHGEDEPGDGRHPDNEED